MSKGKGMSKGNDWKNCSGTLSLYIYKKKNIYIYIYVYIFAVLEHVGHMAIGFA